MAINKFPQFSIVEIPLLTVEKLLLPKIQEKIKNSVKVILMDNDSDMAVKLRNQIKFLVDSDKNNKLAVDLREEYNIIINMLLLPSLIFLNNDQITIIFRDYLIKLIKSDADILWPVENYIDYYQDTSKTFDFVNLATRSMGQNREKIGNVKINLEAEDKKVDPTVGNWLKHYNSFLYENKVKGILKEADFFQNDRFIKSLSDEDVNLLKKVIRLYNFLKFPGQFSQYLVKSKKTLPLKDNNIFFPESDEKMEKEESRENILELEKNKKSMASGEKEILAAYQGNLKQQKAIAKIETKLKKKFADDLNKYRSDFFTSVQSKDIDRSIAILRLLSKANDLEKFLKEDEKLNKFLVSVWEKRYGKEFVADFSKNPGAVKFIRLFLRYVLEERLGMVTSDAARIGMQIGNIFIELGHKDFNQLAYFDMKSKQFGWFEE